MTDGVGRIIATIGDAAPILKALLPACWGQEHFEERGTAQRRIRALHQQGLREYPCRICGQWRIGENAGGRA